MQWIKLYLVMKCIILTRVSTERQSYDEQVNSLLSLAMADGYSKDNIIVIKNKESAIKNDEEHRLGLTEMKKLINEDSSINCVYVREITRIGRREDVNLSIKNFLIDRKIQLVVQEPSIRLFNPDMTLNSGAELVFSIFNTMAKQEMQLKMIRFKQGKIEAVKKGKSITNKVMFGYRKEANGVIIPDEGGDADIVRYMFNKYANDSTCTTTTLYYDILPKLNKTLKTRHSGNSFVRNVLINECYIGKRSKQNKVIEFNYPRIVDDEVFYKVQARLKEMNKHTKVNTKYIKFGKGLVRCECGKVMMGNVDTCCAYVCPDCKKMVNLNVIDTALWLEAKEYKAEQLKRQPEQNKQQYKAQIESNIAMIDSCNVEVEKINNSLLKAYNGYIIGGIDEDRYKAIADNFNAQKKDFLNKIAALKTKNDDLQRMIDSIDNVDEFKAFDDLSTIEDDNIKNKIIHESISGAFITFPKYREVLITLYDIEGKELFNKYWYKQSAHLKMFTAYKEDDEIKIYKEVEINKRYKRNRNKKGSV